MSDLTVEILSPELTLEFPPTFPGGGQPELQEIVDGGSVAVAAGRALIAIGVNSAVGDRTLNVGTSAGGTQILEDELLADGVNEFKQVGQYFPNGGTLYFSGAGTILARIYLI